MRRESARLGTVARQRKLKQILERDGPLCWLCRKPVEWTGGPHAPQRPSLDHVIRMEDGGTHHVDNLRLAHIGCNVMRDRGLTWPEQRRLAEKRDAPSGCASDGASMPPSVSEKVVKS